MERKKRYLNKPSRFNKNPFVEVKDIETKIETGWKSIAERINNAVKHSTAHKKIIVIETYQGVIHEELVSQLGQGLQYDRFIMAKDFMHAPEAIEQMVFQDVTDDRIFGYMTRLTINAYFDKEKSNQIRSEIDREDKGVFIVYGSGAAWLFPEPTLLVYADMARWEIQLRMRQHLVDNLGVNNRHQSDWMLLYKQGYFVDWRVCDRLKKQLFDKMDFVLDTNQENRPKMMEGKALMAGLRQVVQRPFSLVPFFDPGPWGGQWMKEVCQLDSKPVNYAWCFNCVPEENSLLLKFGEEIIETPAVNLVFRHPVELMGDPVHARFGDEFPIRFDFLDTMQGGNLSLQVHPMTSYIQEKFGMPYTQDESYYMMDVEEEAVVYLGFKDGVNPETFFEELNAVQEGKRDFDAEKFVNTIPVKKHDHVLIPAGTIHCSGKESMVLEISATPYIFTFKLWDWGRLGLDGKPRPINIAHGKNVLQWDRTTQWVQDNLVNQVEVMAEGDGWKEERTGLHQREFIETRRHWFTKQVNHDTQGNVHVVCLVDGEEVMVESPTNAFDPFKVHYAEVFVVPAAVGAYTITPSGASVDAQCATMLAYVRY